MERRGEKEKRKARESLLTNRRYFLQVRELFDLLTDWREEDNRTQPLMRERQKERIERKENEELREGSAKGN